MDAERAIEQYGALVMGVIWRVVRQEEDAYDLYQDVFLKYHQAQRRGERIEQPKAWLCRTGLNAALDKVRGRKKHIPFEGEAEEQIGLDTWDQIERGLLLERVRQLAQSLPRRQQQVLVLRCFEGYSFDEIGQLLECSAGAARAAMFQGLKKLRDWLTASPDSGVGNAGEELCQ